MPAPWSCVAPVQVVATSMGECTLHLVLLPSLPELVNLHCLCHSLILAFLLLLLHHAWLSHGRVSASAWLHA